MRASLTAATALAGSMLLALLILGPATASYAPDLGNQHFPRGRLVDRLADYGHPDPCWSLRIRTMNTFSPDAQSRFESCLADYNYN
jgi:hypothetical protein